MMKKKKNNKGFSLVELIVVIAIMAVLVGVLAPQFIKYVDQSRVSTDVQNLQEVITACQVACADETVTPTSGTLAFAATGAPTATNLGWALTNAGIQAPTVKSSTFKGKTLTVTINNGAPEFSINDSDCASRLGIAVTP